MCYDDNIAIEVRGLSKCYRLYEKPSQRLRQALPWQRKRFYSEFWAVSDLSFTLKKGQTLGVIGRNGSGKSTLLQMICGTLTPTEGIVSVRGRIGALLELGSGFNPEFTGLENIRLNAAVLGLKEKEINEKLDAILAFADIGGFAHQPVKHYSSGMVVRLAFAVQAHIDPAILIVDEALAVGDELFQKKCFAHLERLKKQGCSILLVSHSCSQINQHCDEVMIMNSGKRIMKGDPHRVTALYQRLIQSPDAKWEETIADEIKIQESIDILKNTKDTMIGNEMCVARTKKAGAKSKPWFDIDLKSRSAIEYPKNGVGIVSIITKTITGEKINTLAHGEPFDIVLTAIADIPIRSLRVTCFIANQNGTRVTGQTVPRELGKGIEAQANEDLEIIFRFNGGLWPGYYFIGAGICEVDSSGVFLHRVIDKTVIRILDTENILPIGNVDLSRY